MLSPEMLAKPTLGRRLVHWLSGTNSLLHLHEAMFERTLGSSAAEKGDDAELTKAFTAWNQAVQKHVPADRLLIFNPSEGWEPLCRFLNLPLIPSHIQFPHLNRRAEMSSILNQTLKLGRNLDLVFNCVHLALFGVAFLLLATTSL